MGKVLACLHSIFTGQERRCCHRICHTANGVGRPPHATLPGRNGIQRRIHLPGRVDLFLRPAALGNEVFVGIGPVGVVHSAHGVGQVFIVARVQPLVDGIKFIRLAVLVVVLFLLLGQAGAVGFGPTGGVF